MRCFTTFAACLLPLLLVQPTGANDTTLNVNVDPPRQLAGDEAPPIRMAGEHLIIYFGREECRVIVEFTFANESDEPVYCWAGFPDEDLLKRWMFYGPADAQGITPDVTFDGPALWGDYAGRSLDEGALRDFTSWTRTGEGPEEQYRPLPTQLLRIERIAYEPQAIASLGGTWQPLDDTLFNSLMFCHAFSLNLGPRDSVVVGHSYVTRTGSSVDSQHLFNYTLGTGRSWAGSIGHALIEVHLEDGLTVDDLHSVDDDFYPYAATHPSLPGWNVLSPTLLTLEWRDFDPVDGMSYVMLVTNPAEHQDL